MKPELSKDIVFGGKTPRLVIARRVAREIFGPLPLIPIKNEMPTSERKLSGVPSMAEEAMTMARELRRRVGQETLQQGVIVVPDELPFAMAVGAKTTERSDSIVTNAAVSIVPPRSGKETGLIVHADEPTGNFDNHQGVKPVEDASVTIRGTGGNGRYGIGDYSPVERPGIRQVVHMAMTSLVQAPRFHVYHELELTQATQAARLA